MHILADGFIHRRRVADLREVCRLCDIGSLPKLVFLSDHPTLRSYLWVDHGLLLCPPTVEDFAHNEVHLLLLLLVHSQGTDRRGHLLRRLRQIQRCMEIAQKKVWRFPGSSEAWKESYISSFSTSGVAHRVCRPLVRIVCGVQLEQLLLNHANNSDETDIRLAREGGWSICGSPHLFGDRLRGCSGIPVRCARRNSRRDAAQLPTDFVATPPADNVDKAIRVIATKLCCSPTCHWPVSCPSTCCTSPQTIPERKLTTSLLHPSQTW